MNDFHAIAKALAEPQRFEIFEMVSNAEELSCGDIAARCPISQATVSHHLKVLQDTGLLTLRRQGQRHIFSANADVLEMYMRELKGRTTPGAKVAARPAS